MSGLNNLNNTIWKSLTGGIVCGVGAFAGGLIGGPIGIGVGSVVGCTISASIFRLRSLPDIVQNDFTETERMSLLDRGKKAISESKEYLIHLVLDIIAALIKCKSKDEIMNVIGPMIEAGLSFIIRTVVRYLAC